MRGVDTSDHAAATAPNDVELTAAPAMGVADAWKVRCLNCGAALIGPFCAACGQRALPAHPTVRELAGDVFAEFSGWDGKLVETLRVLVRTPGELTAQWLKGHSVRFISPLRLYLTASLVYFLVSAAAPRIGRSATVINVGGVDVVGGRAAPTRPQRLSEAASQALGSGVPLTAAQRDSALADIAGAPWWMQPMLRRAVDDPQAITSGMLKWTPRVLFSLLPVYALILMAFYRRRHYPEHLFFAIHLHAFVFVAVTLGALAKFSGNVTLSPIASGIVWTWIAVYSLLALRRVYGGGLMVTLIKSVGIVAIYAMVVLPALVAAVFLSAFR
jgi:hypothetical protein